MEKEPHLIIITHGVEDGLRQILFAFQYSMSLLNMGIPTSIFLTGLAARWANKNVEHSVQGSDFQSLKGYFERFKEHGGDLYVCRTCFGEECNVSDQSEMEEILAAGTSLVGLSVITELSLKCKVITF
ncbi:hypothetical protein MNBD_BACTEROID05-817 [hydrothermal vent metagenome]|uniref:Uncharacterized protein n=1 Tax=hydrothermal vent metagenome TaxID=652676 RepID=A0A3B0TFH9_9ZZZZ